MLYVNPNYRLLGKTWGNISHDMDDMWNMDETVAVEVPSKYFA